MAEANVHSVASQFDENGTMVLDESGCIRAKKGPDGADRKERRRLASIEYWTTQRDYDHEVELQHDWRDYPPHRDIEKQFNLMKEYATHCSYIEAWHEMKTGQPSRLAWNVISQHVVYTKNRRQDTASKEANAKIDVTKRGEDLYAQALSKGKEFNYTFGLVSGIKVAHYMEFMGLATKDQVKAVKNLDSKVRVWDGRIEIVPKVVLSAVAALTIMHHQVAAADFGGIHIDRGHPMRDVQNVTFLCISLLGGLSFARFLGRNRINATLKTLPMIVLILVMLSSAFSANACRINLAGQCGCEEQHAATKYKDSYGWYYHNTPQEDWIKDFRLTGDVADCTASSTYHGGLCRLELYDTTISLIDNNIIRWRDFHYDVYDVKNRGRFQCHETPVEITINGTVYDAETYLKFKPEYNKVILPGGKPHEHEYRYFADKVSRGIAVLNP